MNQKLIILLCMFLWFGCTKKTTSGSTGNPDIDPFPFKVFNLFDDGTLDTLNSEISITDFQPSSDCGDCHPSHYEEWQRSMHHISINDPLFLSILEKDFNHFGNVGDRFCIQCHSPAMLVTGLFLTDSTELDESSKAVIQDGIGCDICHTTTHLSDGLFVNSDNFIGAEYFLNPGEGVKYGPLQDPEPNEYHESVPNSIFQDSRFCLPCHNIVINNVEAEMTFSEWASSPLTDMANNLPCQSCHMPEVNGHRNHSFTGVDIDLTKPIDDPDNQIRITEINALLDTAVTLSFYTDSDTLPIQMDQESNLTIPLTIQSNTAHSLPSGTSFNREAWIELLVIGDNDEEICSFGNISENDESLNYSEENVIFTSWITSESGDTLFPFLEIAAIEDKTLKIFEKQEHYFNCVLTEFAEFPIHITARMRFRPFKPMALAEHPELLENLPIFDFGEITAIIELNSE